MAFDPCREWLGIDAVDLADPCRVLGLPTGDHAADAISRAAERRLKRLAEVASGPFEKARQTLVRRVEEARDRLLETAAPSEPASAVPGPAATAHTSSVHPLESMEPSPAADGGPAETDVGLRMAAPAMTTGRRARRRRRRRSSGSAGLMVSLGALLTVAVAVLAIVVVQGLPEQAGRQVASTTDIQATASPPPRSSRPESGRRNGSPAGRDVRNTDPRGTEHPTPRERPADDHARTPARDSSPARPDPPSDSTMDASSAADAKPADSRPSAGDRTSREWEIQAAEQAQADRRKRVDRLLSQGLASLQTQDFDAADTVIKQAYSAAGDDVEAATRADAWRVLATYAREFVGYRDRAFQAASAGREYEAGGEVYSIISVTGSHMVYKASGRVIRIPRDQVEPNLAMAIVEKWFAADGRAANHLFLGAHLLCLDPPQQERARAEWRIAGDGGEDVGPLLELCDDPVIRRAANL